MQTHIAAHYEQAGRYADAIAWNLHAAEAAQSISANALAIEHCRRALANLDIPVIVGTITFAAVAIVVMNLVVDMLYAVIDPRVRLAGGAADQ